MKNTNYPICDTDFLVKFNKIHKIEEVISVFKSLYISDAVYQELNNCNRLKPIEKKEAFLATLRKVKSIMKSTKISLIKYNEIDEEKLDMIKFYLFKENIIYDEIVGQYILDENVGEKVSIIYAMTFGLSIILSDDKGSLEYAKKFSRLKVIRFWDMLGTLGYKYDEKYNLSFLGNSDDAENTKKILRYYKENGKVSNLFELGVLQKYKNGYKGKNLRYGA